MTFDIRRLFKRAEPARFDKARIRIFPEGPGGTVESFPHGHLTGSVLGVGCRRSARPFPPGAAYGFFEENVNAC